MGGEGQMDRRPHHRSAFWWDAFLLNLTYRWMGLWMRYAAYSILSKAVTLAVSLLVAHSGYSGLEVRNGFSQRELSL
jgi:hypothetical protein